MSDTSHSASDNRPLYQDNVPLAWTLPQHEPTKDELAALQNSNEEFLKVMYSLDESPPDVESSQDALAQQVLRMDAKLNFLMDMVGQLLLLSTNMPETCPVALRSDGIEWQSDNAPATGSFVYLHLYLKTRYPKPLVLPAKVTAVTPREGTAHISCVFEQHGQNVEDWLEKLVFRQHRRAIARARN